MTTDREKEEFVAWYEQPTTDKLYADFATWRAATEKQATKVALLREALENWSRVIDHQYTGSQEAMSFLQNADNLGQEALEKCLAVYEAADRAKEGAK